MGASTTGTAPANPTFWAGWEVIGGLFAINTITSGFGFYAQAPYLRELVDRFGYSNSMASLATGLFFASSGVAGYLIAGLVDRVDVRRILVAGALWSGACLALLGQVRSPFQMLVLDVAFGVGFAACGLVPVNTIATRWFVRRRSVALSVSSTGLSLGGILITRQVAQLVGDHGLAATAPWFGLVWALVVAAMAVLVVKPSPQAVGLQPDGDDAPPAGTSRAPVGHTFLQARATRFFVLLTVAYVFLMLSQVGALAHQTKLGTDRVSRELGNLAVSITAGTSVLGRLAGGAIVTRVSSRWFTAGLIALQGAALTVLAGAETTRSFVVGSVLLGAAVGNLLMLHPLLLAEAFGVREYAKVYGLSGLFMTLGVSLGPTTVGFFEDRSGYGVALTITALSALVALVLFVAAGPVRQRGPN
jgi:MFS family permease